MFTDRALPAIQPIAFAIDGEDVVIHTRRGSKLDTAVHRAIVAFEADDLDPAARTGWSVTLIGQAMRVEDDRETARLTALPLHPSGSGRFIRIPAARISGRRIHRVGQAA